jgi:phenylacetic acid degradation operon negative regulatory protein
MVVVMETTGGKSTAPEDLIEPGPEAPPTRLMVLGLTHRDGSLRASEIYRVAEAVGLSDDQIRGCLRRLVAEELFTREGEGRDAQYLATTTGLSVLESTKQRHLLAYAQDAAGRGWDRRWRLAGFAIPERARSARDQFRDRLLALGAAPIHNGLYVSPHRWEVEVEAEADRLNIGEFVSQWSTDDLVVGGVSDPRELAAQLWPLEEVADRYRAFIETYREIPRTLQAMRSRDQRISEADFLPGALHIAIRFNQCFEFDPLLPPELLRRPWPGREAREILAACRKIGVLAREDKAGPALFRVFDEVIATLP